MDWKHVAKGMRGRKVFIVRSRHDEGQIPWAVSLEKELRERWKSMRPSFPSSRKRTWRQRSPPRRLPARPGGPSAPLEGDLPLSPVLGMLLE